MKLPLLFLVFITSFVAGGCAQKAKPFTSAAGRFSLESPVELTESVRQVDSEIGKLTMHLFTGNGKTHGFVVGYSDESVNEEKYFPEDTLTKKRASVLAKMQATLVSEKTVTLEGHPGREIIASGKSQGQDVSINERIYLVGHRTYQFVISAPLGQINQSAADAFFTSVKILPPPPVPDPTRPVAFTSTSGRFSVTTPVTLVETVQQTQGTPPVVLHLVMGGEGGPMYTVMFSDIAGLASKDPQPILDRMRDRILAGDKATLISEKNLPDSSCPAREITFSFTEEGHQLTSQYRLYLSPGRLYQTQVMVPGKSPSPDSAAFLDSFKILPPSN